MVGAGTVCSDNPRLTVRHVDASSPVRVVLDSSLRIPLSAHVLTDSQSPTIIAVTDSASTERRSEVNRQGVEVVVIGSDSDGRVDVAELLRVLWARGITSVLVEGGSRLLTSMLASRSADRAVVCIAPKIIGEGINAVGSLAINELSEAVTFNPCSFTPLDGDVIFDGRIERAEPSEV
jgi:5-amino-6-(5-phosphoribosylamino)uracil reductase/diaminohydroxyphosphoribosylaminopyrimidine deaminase/5-amino-6-(5-phosphoribosylamino)uracil reductase